MSLSNLAHSGVAGIRHVVATTASARLELARYLDTRFGIGARLSVATRHEQRVPHIGNVELATEHTGPLAMPLEAVVRPGGVGAGVTLPPEPSPPASSPIA